jgi:hypothetical protein
VEHLPVVITRFQLPLIERSHHPSAVEVLHEPS